MEIKGKAMLLVGRLMEETANFESNAIMKAYKVSAGGEAGGRGVGASAPGLVSVTCSLV